MRNVTEIFSVQNDFPVEPRHLRAAACCHVSTESEEQTSRIQLQERHNSQLLSGNPQWQNAGIFSERARRSESKRAACVPPDDSAVPQKRIDLILTDSISRFEHNRPDTPRSLRDLCGLDPEVCFGQKDMWPSEQRIQIPLTRLLCPGPG